MKREKLDDILKAKLQDYEPESNVPSWTEMHRRMVLAGNASGKPLLRPKRNWFLRYGAAAAVALIAISLGFYYFNEPEVNFLNNLPIAVQNLSEKYTADPAPEESSDEKFIAGLLTSARKLVVFENIQAAAADGVYIAAYDSHIVTEDSEEAPEEVRNESSSEKTSSAISSVSPYGRSRYASQDGGRTLGDFAKKTRSKKGWLAGAYINGTSSSASSNTPARNYYSVFSAASPLMEMSYLNKTLDISAQELKHKYPVSVGLNVRKNLTRRFGVETGLVYSYLESTSEMKGSFNYKYKQKLHYLGIPLYASYSMLSSDKWDLYANAGGMAEIALSARGKTEIFDGDNFASQSTAKLSAPGVVWSLGANLGVDYSLVNNLGVYIEPGIGYYFDNDKQPESYRTDKPLMFNLRAGLRVKF